MKTLRETLAYIHEKVGELEDSIENEDLEDDEIADAKSELNCLNELLDFIMDP